MAALLVVMAFAAILGELAWQGAARLSWSFLVEEPLRAGREGGIAPILLSTVLLLVVCIAACLPLALGTALLLTETRWERVRWDG